MATDRINPIAQEIELLIAETWSPTAQAGYVREYAQEQLKRAQGVNQTALGYLPEHRTFVDRAERPDLSSVTGSSTIVFEFELVTDVVQRVDEMLRKHSPVGREAKTEPRYSESHVWFADDKEVTDLAKLPPAEQYIVINATPYARKIEGSGGRRPLSRQAPDGVYEVVAAMAKRQFGNIAYVGFGYRSFPYGAIGRWAQSASAAKLAREVRGGRVALHEEWLTRQPAIIVDPGRG